MLIFRCIAPPHTDGNPVSDTGLTSQQQGRAATFLFRQRQNFTVMYRTEIGASVLKNMNEGGFEPPTTDCPEGHLRGTPDRVKNDLVNANLAWINLDS